MPRWVNLGSFEEGRSGSGSVYEADGLRLAVFRAGDEVVALSDRCPHAGGSLGQGWIEDAEVVCPLHRWRFQLADGRCSTMRGQIVHRFQAEVRGCELWVRV